MPLNPRRIITLNLFVVLLLLLSNTGSASNNLYFKITVIDAETGRGVPMVELTTTNEVRYYTDSNGIVAFFEPGMMGQVVYFRIKSHGYEFPQDIFGNRGQALKVSEGGSAVIKLKRLNVAERLYRITGEGIYRDSNLVGQVVPIRSPLLNAQVTGQDSVMVAPYRGKLYWFWGDTNKLSYALGNFATSGATSEWPEKGGLDPGVGIDLNYFINESGFSREMCPIAGPGPKWIAGLVTVADENGAERLIARYERIKNLGEAYERGLVMFNDRTDTFDRLVQFDLNVPLYLDGHPFRAIVNSEDYFYFSFSPPYGVRVRADMKHIINPKVYEGFTCLVSGSRYDKSSTKLDRSPDGRLIYGWKANTPPILYAEQQQLIAAGKMKQEEAWLQLQDIVTGAPIESHSGSVFWNQFRQRWIMIMQQTKGLSDNGELWYAEADTPVGPWVYARRILTHDKYTFYNPTQHPFFDRDHGRVIYLEGTYSNFFSGSPDKTPRYDYNQIMYRLTLDTPKLSLPVPVYLVKGLDGAARYLLREELGSNDSWDKIREIPFFAVPRNRQREGLIPIFATIEKGEVALHSQLTPGNSQPVFYALPATPVTNESLMGSWHGKLKSQDGSEFPVALELRLEGDQVTGTAGQGSITRGTFKDGKLEVEVKDDESTYSLLANLKQGKLTGNWKEPTTKEAGTWEAERVSPFQREATSPAVVPLYEYRDIKLGARFYSTRADLETKTIKRAAQPVCRVWRNPMSLLILDRQARPVSM